VDEHRRPVFVGVGQVTVRNQAWPDLASPLDLLVEAISSAARDTGTRVLGHVDHLSVANIASWDYGDAPAIAAERLGLGERTELVGLPVGGNTPQWAVNQIARRLANGELDVAVVAGGEAFAAKRAAKRAGHRVDWGRSPHSREPAPEQDPSHPVERAHGIVAPSITYPLWEPALRVAADRSPQDHAAHLGRMMARFTEVAAANPYAWFPQERSAEELLTVTTDNRMVATPYPKLLNAMMRVDQGAAVILTTAGRARALGVPEDRWVYLLGGGDCNDLWHLTERTTYDHSPGMRAVADQVWSSTGLGIDDVAHIDFYSCFPSAVQLAMEAFGIAADDPRPLTVTGGLAYAGGPGNNYVTHAIATMVERLRANPGDVGLCTGLGWHVTKHSAGLFSTRPTVAEFSPVDPSADQRRIDSAAHPSVETQPRGKGTIEAYSVAFDRDGAPAVARCLVRLDEHRRTATSSIDPTTVEALCRDEWYGRAVEFSSEAGFQL
jgi:acetyl-CoA C-acetyltransferase